MVAIFLLNMLQNCMGFFTVGGGGMCLLPFKTLWNAYL